MVYYLRFLTPPKLDIRKGTVRVLLTVTTDLGDAFYPGDLTLYAIAVTSEVESGWQSAWQTRKWKSGMRTIWIEIRDLESSPPELMKLIVNTQKTTLADSAQFDRLPEVLSVRSGSFGGGAGWDKLRAGDRIERRFRTEAGQERVIYEETGESIARHVWDAGIALATCLSHIISQLNSMHSLSEILEQHTSHSPKVIELGSGCGIVGLEVAHLCPASDVLLTDLPEAMGILNHNVSKAKFSSTRVRVAAAILDWDKPLPDDVARNHYDLLVVSDCTYNSDSIPALVRTLAALIANSPAALIAISMKVRHDSEAVFFDLMAEAELTEIDSVTIELPDRIRQETKEPLEAVYVYVYEKDGMAQQPHPARTFEAEAICSD